ncbi:MAG: hypothetical protein RR988_05420 [Clostridia bacterium]
MKNACVAKRVIKGLDQKNRYMLESALNEFLAVSSYEEYDELLEEASAIGKLDELENMKLIIEAKQVDAKRKQIRKICKNKNKYSRKKR